MPDQPLAASPSPDRAVLALGLFSALTAVVLAAVGAHGPLAPTTALAQRELDTASLFHLAHSLALMVLAFWPASRAWRGAVALSWLAGLVLFTGSLYALTIFTAPWPGLLTPIGGLLLMIGWLIWLVGVLGLARPR